MISSVLKELTDSAAESRLVTVVRRGEMQELTGVPVAVGSRLMLVAGARNHQEYWIPAEEMDDFNAAIVGPIEVVADFRREGA